MIVFFFFFPEISHPMFHMLFLSRLDLLGGQWSESNDEGMFGASSIADNGDTPGNFFHGSYLNGHSNLGAMSGTWKATNWGGAPEYANLGLHARYPVPNESGVDGRSRIGGEGQRAYRQIHARYV